MVHGRKELSEVKGDNASLEFGTPSSPDNVGKEATSIFSGVLTNPSELVGMEDTVLGSFELHSGGQHFLK
jgi:hypothetical protein